MPGSVPENAATPLVLEWRKDLNRIAASAVGNVAIAAPTADAVAGRVPNPPAFQYQVVWSPTQRAWTAERKSQGVITHVASDRALPAAVAACEKDWKAVGDQTAADWRTAARRMLDQAHATALARQELECFRG